ncbi:uncharacterized protein LY89DRAFT_674854 [Mollisia scopiformis]|uniref:Uncharacterized protein n=1 Tax=Mollisia scopiformis TaxID=149040 RepID=A0A194WRX6_MOLSC|nr:uncharacterized protein LY89DRAFT_674854 [Mollisia scopiformis]KUJ10731.1 hypothetical protein LY89DRAFT_674854 [Mollisia scopiformis]
MAARFRGAPGGDFGHGPGVQYPQIPEATYAAQGPQSGRRPGSEGYDGPSEPRQNPFGQGLGYDPARPIVKAKVITNTRVELPPDAYRLELHDGFCFCVEVFCFDVVGSKVFRSDVVVLKHDELACCLVVGLSCVDLVLNTVVVN